MEKDQNKTWREAYNEKMQLGWSRIDRMRFQQDFMNCQYEEVTEKFNVHGEPLNEKALRDYFNRIKRGEKPATDEATNFANDYFRLND